MSKLDNLIAELCPEGVEYKTLGDIGTIVRGNGLQKKDFSDSGVGCIHYGQIYTYYGLFTSTTKSFVSPEIAAKLAKVQTGDIIIAVTSENVEDVCKCVAWLGKEEIVTGGHSAIFKHTQNPKYITYWLQSEAFATQKRKIAQGTKVIDVHPRKLKEVVIPVPPLPVQCEIVRILDTFTELTEELTEELTARRKQYEYYRDKLLIFEDDEWIKLSDLFHTRNGYTPSKSNKSFWENGTIPWFRMEDIRSNGRILAKAIQYVSKEAIKGKPFPENSLIISTSATIGEHALITVESLANQRFTCLVLKEKFKKLFIPKFLYYYCFKLDEFCVSHTKKGSFPTVDMSKFNNFMFPLVPLKQQEYIISILDRFDALCNDLTQGLPAEIEARKKQYEYYRDKLLTFKQKRKA